MLRLAGIVAAAGIGLVLLLSTGASGQDSREPPARGRQLPQGWKQIGLSKDQTEKIYQIRAEYRTKISKLEAQLKELRTAERKALFRVLTEDQKAALRRLAAERASEPGTTREQKGGSSAGKGRKSGSSKD